MTTKRYRPWAPDQAYLIPPTPRDWLPESHLAYFILDVVDELDLSEIEAAIQERDPRGTQPYDPRMMTALLLYSYSVGLFSSRRMARATFEDVAVRFIVADQHPHFTRIAAFRRDHLSALSKLFVQAVRLCAEAGLVKLGHVSIDGTKIRANASKHKAMSYDRMKREEQRLQDEIAALLARAEAEDREEDARYGQQSDGNEVPEELRRRESRLARIREAKAALEQEAKAARAAKLREQQAQNEERAESAPDEQARKAAATRARKQAAAAAELEEGAESEEDDPPDDTSPPGLPLHRPAAETNGTPKPKAQRNFTDPDSRIMRDGDKAFVQAYNAQAVVDDAHQVIVAAAVSNQPPDTEYLVPVVDQVEDIVGARPDCLTADAGYWSPENAAWCEQNGIDAYIAVQRQRHGPAPPDPDESAGTPPPKTPKQEMAEKLRTEKGREMYRKRKFTPEPVFGQIKEARGFRRFMLRGLDAVQREWALVCATHNLLKLYRACPGGKLALTVAG
ncbi:MAG TPA: IS1182 family transposase [Polyangiaceae bacterium]|nr:IS1182 family transposase [Polyangiaceae bacterium]